MDPKSVAELITFLTKDFSEAQRFELLGRVCEAVTRVVPAGKTAAQPQERVQAVQPKEQVPAGRVMIPVNHDCECDGCGTVVYRTNTDVFEIMQKKDFVAAFTPLGGAPELPMPLDTFADENGNISIDCPICKGTKSLWIKGKGDVPFNQIPEGKQP